MNSRTIRITPIVIGFGAGLIFGALIWALSPSVTGYTEPWDAQAIYYPVAVFLSGLLAALVHPKTYWLPPIGIIIGQLAYMLLFLEVGPFVVLGGFFLVAYSVPAFVGATIVFLVFKVFQTRTKT